MFQLGFVYFVLLLCFIDPTAISQDLNIIWIGSLLAGSQNRDWIDERDILMPVPKNTGYGGGGGGGGRGSGGGGGGGGGGEGGDRQRAAEMAMYRKQLSSLSLVDAQRLTHIDVEQSDSHVTAQVGHPAYLKCSVLNLGDQMVTTVTTLEIRSKMLKMLKMLKILNMSFQIEIKIKTLAWLKTLAKPKMKTILADSTAQVSHHVKMICYYLKVVVDTLVDLW